MALSTILLAFLVFGMLFTGTINTILNKLQGQYSLCSHIDLQCVGNCEAKDPNDRKYYEQPVMQTITMFIGEACCLTVYFITSLYNTPENSTTHQTSLKPMTGWANFWFLIPTLCDLVGTTLMNVGLIYTSASIYQMLRGSVV